MRGPPLLGSHAALVLPLQGGLHSQHIHEPAMRILTPRHGPVPSALTSVTLPVSAPHHVQALQSCVALHMLSIFACVLLVSATTSCSGWRSQVAHICTLPQP